MANTAEKLAAQFGITRAQCDEFALRSQVPNTPAAYPRPFPSGCPALPLFGFVTLQAGWAAAQKAGIFAREIAPITVKGKKVSRKQLSGLCSILLRSTLTSCLFPFLRDLRCSLSTSIPALKPRSKVTVSNIICMHFCCAPSSAASNVSLDGRRRQAARLVSEGRLRYCRYICNRILLLFYFQFSLMPS